MGTPEFAVPAFHAVVGACDVVAVVTRPDQPQGRGRVIAESPVSRAAEQRGIERLKPEDPGGADLLRELRRLAPDLVAVVAFGAILPRELLAIPLLGSINLHGSLLPEYRGASPVQRALWDGRLATGVTTLWMDEGIDTGDVIHQCWEPIRAEDDAGTLASRLATLGAPLLAESLLLAARGAAPRRPQNRDAGSYARKLVKADGMMRWDREAESVWNHQRAVTPWPGASTILRGKPVLVTRTRPLHRLALDDEPGTILGIEGEGVSVACAPGALLVLALKPEGRAEMSGADWARGARPEPGERFGSEVAV